MINKTLLDNTAGLRMVDKLRECIADPAVDTIRIATGYWDIPGMALLAGELRGFFCRPGARLKIIIGKDPYVYAKMLTRATTVGANYPADFIRTDMDSLADKMTDEYRDAFRLLMDNCRGDDPRIDIHVFKTGDDDERQFFHSKCYIFTSSDDCEKSMYAIVGSSNFTQKGLEGNAELNVLENDAYMIGSQSSSTRKGHIGWFDEKWEQSEEWTGEFLEQVLRVSKPARKMEEEVAAAEAGFTPYELYIKLLQLEFADVVDMDLGRQIEAYLPRGVRKLDYQIEAVKRCLGIMREHGGFMLADVVGLGKTVVGTLIVKHFLASPDDGGRARRVLVVTPPAILPGWRKTMAAFDREADEKILPLVDFVTTGRVGNMVDDASDDDDLDSGEFDAEPRGEDYGLVIVDESHKFRNSATQMYEALDTLIADIGVRTGVYPYVGLLSATPQNNRPSDLKNQLCLFERNRTASTLKKADGGNLDSFFARVGGEYEVLLDRRNDIPAQERRARLDALSAQIRDCVLADILERRTRTDLSKYYAADLAAQGIVFPTIDGPRELPYVMDDELARLFADTMRIIAPTDDDKARGDEWLRYYRYRAIEYFADPANERKHAGRGNRGAGDVARQLATIMQIMLVKRLESSFAAFRGSLLNLKRYTLNMIRMWECGTIFICPDIDVNAELDCEAKSRRAGREVTFDECLRDVRAKMGRLAGRDAKGRNAVYRRQDFRGEYADLLRKDFEIISALCDRWAANTEDPKFDAFKERLNAELFAPGVNTEGKLVIFSEAIATVTALARAVRAKGHRPLVVTAANRDDAQRDIEENFDANYAGEWRDDYDVIITTEVLAEGVNLHRANVILNYDTPWNSTRLMQRIGRVNRIGSRARRVCVFNFMPSAEGDAQIELVRKAYTKLQAFHSLFGEDSKIFTADEEVAHFDLARAVNGDESPLEKYIHELKTYKEAHPDRYRQIEQEAEWQMAQTGGDGARAYFVVRAPRSARLAVRIGVADAPRRPQVVSMLELLEELRPAEGAERAPLPADWAELTGEAVRAYNQYFVRMSASRPGGLPTEAKGVLARLSMRPGLTPESQRLLGTARQLVNRGNLDIARKIVALGRELADTQSRLFELGPQDIDEVIRNEIGRLVARVEARQGEPVVELGSAKYVTEIGVPEEELAVAKQVEILHLAA